MRYVLWAGLVISMAMLFLSVDYADHMEVWRIVWAMSLGWSLGFAALGESRP